MREWEIWHHWFSSQEVLIRVERTSNYAISVQWMSWLFTFPAFLSICTKHANFYLWKFWPETPEVFSWWASMLPIGGNLYVPRSLHVFFSVTKAKSPLPPCPRKMHECKWEVCMVCLLQCTTFCAVSWEIELGFELELVSCPSVYFSLGPVFISLSRCLYAYGAIESGYPQANQTSLFAGGRYWNCIFTIFEENNGIKARTLFITWSWIHVIRILSFNYLQGKAIGCCWHRGRTSGMWPSVVGRSALTPLSTRSTPWWVKIRVANLFCD